MKKNVDDNYIYSWFDCNVDLINRTIYMGSISKDDCDGESGVCSCLNKCNFHINCHLVSNPAVVHYELAIDIPSTPYP